MPRSVRAKFAASEAYLYGRFNFERVDSTKPAARGFRLETMRRLLERLGDPHLTYPVIHVAGTKGKGSVVTMIAGIMAAAGYRVGLYRSPHLETARERIAVNDQLIRESEFCDVIDSLRGPVAELDRESEHDPQVHPPTFFEIVTSAAMVYFHQRQVDWAIFEVGLGGRLDSTNICRPALTLITNVGLDHQRQLGSTKSKIAAEKAGIIKQGVPLFCGVRDAAPARVIAAIADERSAPSFWMGRDFGTRIAAGTATDNLTFSAWGVRPHPYDFKGLRTRMYGRHQVVNASLAIAATQWLTHNGWEVDESAIRRGLESAAIDGRFQVIDGDPPVIIDVAHNAMSARAFAAALDERYADRCRRTLVFSASKDKRILPMMRRLFASFDRIILTTIRDNPRACDLERLRSVAERALAARRDNGARGAPTLEVHADQRQAIIAAHDGVTDLVAVCGSVFLIGQILPILRGAEPKAQPRAKSSKTQAVN